MAVNRLKSGENRNEPLAELLLNELRQGGFTVKWPADVRIPGAGSGSVGPWVVSIGGHEVKAPIAEWTAEGIDAYADGNEGLLRERTLWFDGWLEEGLGYLDVSRVYPEGKIGYEKAMEFAESSQQLAIYDAGLENSIDTGTPFDKYIQDQEIDEEL